VQGRDATGAQAGALFGDEHQVVERRLHTASDASLRQRWLFAALFLKHDGCPAIFYHQAAVEVLG
jgi:hypothetical protein